MSTGKMNAISELEAPASADKAPGAVRPNERARKLARRVALVTVVLPFLGVVAAVVLLWGHGVGWLELALLAAMYAATITGIGVGFHRYITHRAFQTNNTIKTILVILGSMAAEGPVLFWAATHRRHHSFSDREGDPHSPHLHDGGTRNALRGFWHAHTSWMLSPDTTMTMTAMNYYAPDLLRDPIIFKLNRLYFAWVLAGLMIPALVEGLIVQTWAGVFYGFLWGGLVRIFLVHQASWSINSICHLYGSRPYQNRDRSSNNFLMALLSFGEGWHNNHHAFPSSAMHGLRWWEIDFSAYMIRTLEKLGLAWNVKKPALRAMTEGRSRR
jgi:stearoyl-CoA desaturase (delta-9 desaturase)